MKRSEIRWAARISVDFYGILERYGSEIKRKNYRYRIRGKGYIEMGNRAEGFLFNCTNPEKLLNQVTKHPQMKRGFRLMIKDIRGMFSGESFVPVDKSLIKV
jgi:hypothetical protein